ncbi:ABC transporter ATP-binding protein [Corynebacterium choanae]|uniref:Macrolide export ATP-binding/permease protein MacB n=1 Tax=Corynebacterium choanae TaxID=1862358 RepID=A0A3G6JC32_9CORY|nr:ABC transporter ATP-binding protein [Corynebacterium choanae]AZA14658.1 Macrolide export ATP-binding/permease protein MacB [Corynebacterium choanae]
MTDTTHNTPLHPALQLTGVSKHYADGNHTIAALTDVNCTLYPGQMAAILGPSGAGKSTLLQVAGCLDAPTAGQITIAGTPVATNKEAVRAKIRREHVGYVFQEYNLLEGLTLGENVSLPLELDGVASATALQQASDLLEQMGLADMAHRFPAEVSGGQRQRAAIARALVGKRSIILADEPTGALDTTTAEQVMAVIRQRVDDGACAIVVTHEPRLAAYADVSWVLRGGVLSDGVARGGM